MDPSIVNRAAPPGSLRYFAALYAPADARNYVHAIYAIEAELRDSAASANHDVAHMRLRWWREEAERLHQGRPQHPASQALLSAPAKPDWALLQQLLFAAEIELSRMTFATEHELNAYLERSGGTLQQLIATLAGATDLSAENARRVRRLGAIARHAEVLRGLRNEARSGRIYVPLQTLDGAKLAHADLSADEAPAALRRLIAAEASRSLAEYRRVCAEFDREQRARLRPVLVFAALHARILERLAAGSYCACPPLELGAFERAWVAWRTAVRAR
jgi:phytoene synthase